MDCAKGFQVAGLCLFFFAGIFLSVDALGRGKVYAFILRWYERFRKYRQMVSLIIGIAVAIVALYLVDIWKTPLIKGIIPSMFDLPIISICISAIVALAVVQLVIGGRESFGRIWSGMVAIGLVCYRFVTSSNRWKSLPRRLLDQIMSGLRLLINPSKIIRILKENRKRVIYILSVAYFYVLILSSALAYLTTKHSVFWVISLTINLSFIISFSLIMIGFLLARATLSGLQFIVREDAEKTFSRLSFVGFVLLAFGFILQLVGIIIG